MGLTSRVVIVLYTSREAPEAASEDEDYPQVTQIANDSTVAPLQDDLTRRPPLAVCALYSPFIYHLTSFPDTMGSVRMDAYLVMDDGHIASTFGHQMSKPKGRNNKGQEQKRIDHLYSL